MIQISPGACIFVINSAVSFKTRIKGMVAYCRDILECEPMDGAYFVFRNRSGVMVRVLFYDGDGFWLCEKRFSSGSIKGWPDDNQSMTPVSARELLVLLWHGDPSSAKYPAFWKRVA